MSNCLRVPLYDCMCDARTGQTDRRTDGISGECVGRATRRRWNLHQWDSFMLNNRKPVTVENALGKNTQEISRGCGKRRFLKNSTSNKQLFNNIMFNVFTAR